MSRVLEIFNLKLIHDHRKACPEINLKNLAKNLSKDTIGILKDEPVVEEKKQIKRNPPNSLAAEQSTQGTGTRTRQVFWHITHFTRYPIDIFAIMN